MHRHEMYSSLIHSYLGIESAPFIAIVMKYIMYTFHMHSYIHSVHIITLNLYTCLTISHPFVLYSAALTTQYLCLCQFPISHYGEGLMGG